MQGIYRFGPYSVQGNPPNLKQINQELKLPQRQLAALLVLLEADGLVVPKEQFFKQIWNGVFVEEGNLTQTIFLLRRKLGRRADGGEYIETLFRQGYRLGSTYEEQSSLPPPDPRPPVVPVSAEAVVKGSPPELEAHPLRRQPWQFGLALLAVAVLGGAGLRKVESLRRTRGREQAIQAGSTTSNTR